MNSRTCTKCGHPLPEQAQFCGECGAVTAAPAALTRTMLHIAAPAPASVPAPDVARAPGPLPDEPPLVSSGVPQGPPTPQGPPPQAPTAPTPGTPPVDFKRTMLGFGAQVPQAPTAATPPTAPAAAPTPPAAPPPRTNPLGSTMLGMAPQAPTGATPTPSISGPPHPTPPVSTAPLSTPPLSRPPQAQPERVIPNRTMLGVAIPGIAPLRAGDDKRAPLGSTIRHRDPLPQGVDLPLPAVLPAPPPMADLPVPTPPRIVRKRGVPLAAVALIAGGLLLVGGGTIAFLWHGATPIAAAPRVSPEGSDMLHLTCDPASCKDGTVVTVDTATATFAAGAADLPLAQALHVGQNALSLHVDRPGMGRDEVIALSVPVAYRVRADVTGMSDPHPSILIHVEAVAGSDVRVADKSVTLDGNGVGTYAIDESTATEGPADESHVVSLDVPYTVASAGRTPEKGTVSARVAVAPLRVDAPGARAVVESDQVLLAGRAAKGATVTVDGAAATVGADGTFEKSVPLAAPGDVSIEVRSGTTALAPRTVHIAVKRVASLADEAKAFEKQPTIGYDAAVADLAGSAGKPIVVDGEVVEPRASGHRTLLLVDDRRGCAKGPCLARVVIGQEIAVGRGDRLRAYGRVARTFTTPSGQSVPEIEADFVLRPKR